MNIEQEKILKKVLGEYEIINSLQGGMMNEAFVVSSKNEKFVSYFPTAQANEMVDRLIEKETQDIAEKLGVTRETIYFDTKNGVKISRYLDGVSLNHTDDFDYKKVAELLYRYHSSNSLSSKDYMPINRLLSFKNEAAKYTDFASDFYELFDIILKEKQFLEGQAKCLAHNDAQRSNIIKTNDGNYYLIDYEFAMNNDPVYDLATFGNGEVEDGLKLVDEYFKLSPLENIKKRYLLWRIDISLQWYLVALIKHYRGEGKTHNMNFLDVADHFLENAKIARSYLK